MTVRTRLAPSPTGDPHVGTAYQALFGKLWAVKNHGRFILRIEDTDRERSRPRHEAAIMECLKWLGLDWDEGPDVGGPTGPYRQSERLPIYRKHVDMLLGMGHAYPCFCTRERLEEARREQAARGDPNRGYDRHCRDIPCGVAADRVRKGEPHVIRMKAPLEGECVFTDLLRGEIRKDWASIDDQVILKSDGFPTYHLAVVVDDHLMEITHIIRGEEWINSVPKHVLLFGMFGWTPPAFCHLPLLRNPDKSKLSKRKNPTSIQYYRRAGYLPEALLNYLGMMGWSMPGGEEKFTFQEMLPHFDLTQIRLGGPVFDLEKLRWLNGRYIREDYTPRRLLPVLSRWALNDGYFEKVLGVVGERMETLGDWARLSGMFFSDGVDPSPEDLKAGGMDADGVLELLQVSLWYLEELDEWNEASIREVFEKLSGEFGMRPRELNAPFYAALTGARVGPPLYSGMEVLGPDLSRRRIHAAMEALGGMSGKRLRALEKSRGRG
jgi:glutamyl-tRNA synthetase